eukprot:895008-Prorocentrum_minimum.AAC.1
MGCSAREGARPAPAVVHVGRVDVAGVAVEEGGGGEALRVGGYVQRVLALQESVTHSQGFTNGSHDYYLCRCALSSSLPYSLAPAPWDDSSLLTVAHRRCRLKRLAVIMITQYRSAHKRPPPPTAPAKFHIPRP